MGVNPSSLWRLGLLRKKGKRRFWADIVLPLFGFVFCASTWWNRNGLAKIVGGIWLLLSFCWLAATTNWFRWPPKTIDFSET